MEEKLSQNTVITVCQVSCFKKRVDFTNRSFAHVVGLASNVASLMETICSFPLSATIDGAKSASVNTSGLKGHSPQAENPATPLSSIEAFANASPNKRSAISNSDSP